MTNPSPDYLRGYRDAVEEAARVLETEPYATNAAKRIRALLAKAAEPTCARCGGSGRSPAGNGPWPCHYCTKPESPPSPEAAPERLFGIHSEDRRKTPLPHSVPWVWMAQHEEAAYRNHSQSLETLDRRGGLGWHEIIAAMRGDGRTFTAITKEFTFEQAQAFVLADVAKWREAAPHPSGCYCDTCTLRNLAEKTPEAAPVCATCRNTGRVPDGARPGWTCPDCGGTGTKATR